MSYTLHEFAADIRAALTADPARGERLWAFCEEATAVQWPSDRGSSERRRWRRRSGR